MANSPSSKIVAEPASERMPAKVPILGVGLSPVSMDGAVRTIMRWIGDRHKTYVTVNAVHSMMDAQDDPEIKRIMNAAGMCVPDGVPLVWLLWLAGHGDTTRVFGPDLMLALCAALAGGGGAAFYYGGAPGVADRLADKMAADYPGLRTAGTYCPPFRELTAEEEEEVVGRINRSGADIVWVGLSSPKQERWMARFRPRIDVPVLVGVGAAFDFNTGGIDRAPRWMQKCALEWVYRLLQEPRRLWWRYARKNPLFVFYIACEKLRLRKFG